MKKVAVLALLILSTFITSCNILLPSNDSLPSSSLVLTADAGDNIILQVYSFPPPKDIGPDTPINLQIYITNNGKDDISGILETSDNVYDSEEYGGIQGSETTNFLVPAVKEKGQRVKPVQIQEISAIQYNKATEIKNVVFNIILKTTKKKELLSSPFCIKQRIDDNVNGCDSHPRISFVPLDPVVSLSDFEFFGSTSSFVDKVKFRMNLNENSRCTIIKDDLSSSAIQDADFGESQIVKASANLVQSNVFFDCKVSSTKSPNQKIIICDNTNDLTFTQSYYQGEKIKAELSYGCSYLFTTNLNLLKKEEIR